MTEDQMIARWLKRAAVLALVLFGLAASCSSADATAYQTDAESKARAAAITREANALQANPGLVQLRIAERWDGKLPSYTGNSIPLLQLR